MGAIRQDFTIWRGTSPIIEFTVTKDDGSAENVSTWTAELNVRQTATDADPTKLTKAAAVYDGPNGKMRVLLTKAETLSLAKGDYAFTFERTNSGLEDVVTYGVLTVKLDIKNAA